MDILVITSQALLYICFALLMGGLILPLVSTQYRPAILIPFKLYSFSAIAIPILAFFPVLNIILYITPRLGFFESVQIVLTTYTIGNAWDITLIVSILLLFVLRLLKREKTTLLYVLGIFLTAASMISVAWASHAFALSPITGIISDSLHLMAVSVWVGILLIVGWFTTNTENWIPFLKWFSLVAISCLSLTAISGLFLMDILVDNYVNSWIISYGTGLLLKHLFILPLIFYAVFNSVFVKYKMAKDPSYPARKGVRVESFILLSMFIMTAIFSQQSPPHGYTLTEEMISPIFRLFNDSPINELSRVGFVVKLPSVFFFFMAVLFTFLSTVLAFFKKTPAIILFICSCVAISSILSMILAAIAIR